MSGAATNLFISDWREAPRSTGASSSVFAVGDVHGCLDLARALVGAVAAQLQANGERGRLIFLGDYIDRGPASLATLRFLAQLSAPQFTLETLLGNHDLFLSLIARDDKAGVDLVEVWSGVGGRTTLREQGVREEDLYRLPIETIRARIRDALGGETLAFLGRLTVSTRIGDVVFAHAGVAPAVALEAQEVDDLITIREPFLSGAGWRHEVCVVHGHTIRGHELLAHRASVDTGAWRTGVLSCVEWRGARMRWLCVTGASTLAALEGLARSDPTPMAYRGPIRLAPAG